MATVETWYEDGVVEVFEVDGGYMRLDVMRLNGTDDGFRLRMGTDEDWVSLMPKDFKENKGVRFNHVPSVMEMCEAMAKHFKLVCVRLNGRSVFDAAQMALDDADLEF